MKKKCQKLANRRITIRHISLQVEELARHKGVEASIVWGKDPYAGAKGNHEDLDDEKL